MTPGWRHLLLSSALLLLLLVGVAVVLGLLGSIVFVPQLGALGWVAIGLGLFLAVQLVVFRLFGLHSRADDEAAGKPDAPPPDEAEETDDWRAWRG